MAVPRFCWRLRIGGSVDRSGEGGGEGVEFGFEAGVVGAG
jgi:hypothetical protein